MAGTKATVTATVLYLIYGFQLLPSGCFHDIIQKAGFIYEKSRTAAILSYF